jgi:hypothetical protein
MSRPDTPPARLAARLEAEAEHLDDRGAPLQAAVLRDKACEVLARAQARRVQHAPPRGDPAGWSTNAEQAAADPLAHGGGRVARLRRPGVEPLEDRVAAPGPTDPRPDAQRPLPALRVATR